MSNQFHETGDWNIANLQEICHKNAEDLREKINLIIRSKHAYADGKEATRASWETSGTWSLVDDSKTGWWGSPGLNQSKFGIWGGMRGSGDPWIYSAAGSKPYDGTRGDVFGAFGSPVTPTLIISAGGTKGWGPGCMICWFEDEPIDDVSITEIGDDYLKVASGKAWQLRVGTPFLVSGSSLNLIDGFYRVVTVDDTTKITVEDANGDAVTFTATQKTVATKGDINSDFGGDWYANKGWENATWAQHDENDPEESTKRPPTGGLQSADSSSDWIRTANPNWYHHFDKNSHRVICNSYIDSAYEQHESTIKSYEFLSINADPKEQEPPVFYEDTGRIKWQHNAKVEIKQSHITNPDKLGARHDVQGCIYSGTGCSIDEQYRHVTPAGNSTAYTYGSEPTAGGTQWATWVEDKFDEALQNMIELAICEADWCAAVDADFIANWQARENARAAANPPDVARVYADEVDYDSSIPRYASLNDELWGCNSSAIELLLKLSDNFDWYWDDVYPYTPKSILDFAEEDAGWTYDEPVGTWRRTFKHSMGRVSVSGTPFSMMQYESGTPSGDTWTESSVSGLTWPGIFKKTTAPAASNYYTDNYTTTPASYIITLSGDQTSKLKAGYVIWTSSAYTTILRSTYDSGTGNTTVVVNDDWGTSSLTFYVNTYISERHDACLSVGSCDYYNGIIELLNECHDLLNSMSQKFEDVSSNAYSWGWNRLTSATGVSGSTIELCAKDWLEYIESERPDDIGDWAALGGGLGSFSIDDCPMMRKDGDTWEMERYTFGAVYEELALKLASPFYNNGAISIEVLISLLARGTDYDTDPPTNSPPVGATGVPSVSLSSGGSLTAEIGPDRKSVYNFVGVSLGAGEVYFIVVKPANTPWLWKEFNDGLNDVAWATYCANMSFKTGSGKGTVITYSWDNIPSEIWERDLTRALYFLEDPATDTSPPEPDPLWWYDEPYIYDKNIEGGLNVWATPYNEADYVPNWAVRMVVYPCEDLGYPDVKYSFVHEWPTPDEGDADPPDKSSGWQDEFEHEFIIGTEAAVNALKSIVTYPKCDLTKWTFKVQSRDGKPTPNVGSYNSTETIDMTDFNSAY